MAQYQGSCLCGACRFTVDAPVKWVAHCHCSLCQRAHGAVMVTWVGVAESQCQVSTKNLTWYTSTPGAERAHCQTCGTPMYFRSSRWPGELHIARVLFDNAELPAPQAHVYCHSTPEWMQSANELPRFETLPSEQ